MSYISALVILTDVAVGFIEQILVSVKLVLQEGASQLSLHQPLALRGVLPVGETDFLHNVVDVGDDALDNDVGVGILRLVEHFGQRFLGSVSLLCRVSLFLGLDDVPGDVQDLLEKLQAGEKTLLMALFDSFQPLP